MTLPSNFPLYKIRSDYELFLYLLASTTKVPQLFNPNVDNPIIYANHTNMTGSSDFAAMNKSTTPVPNGDTDTEQNAPEITDTGSCNRSTKADASGQHHEKIVQDTGLKISPPTSPTTEMFSTIDMISRGWLPIREPVPPRMTTKVSTPTEPTTIDTSTSATSKTLAFYDGFFTNEALPQASFTDCVLVNCSGTNLTLKDCGVYMVNCDVHHISYPEGNNPHGGTFTNTSFTNCSLEDCSGTDLTFNDCDILACSVDRSTMTNCKLAECPTISDCSLTETLLTDSNLLRCTLTDCAPVDCRDLISSGEGQSICFSTRCECGGRGWPLENNGSNRLITHCGICGAAHEHPEQTAISKEIKDTEHAVHGVQVEKVEYVEETSHGKEVEEVEGAPRVSKAEKIKEWVVVGQVRQIEQTEQEEEVGQLVEKVEQIELVDELELEEEID